MKPNKSKPRKLTSRQQSIVDAVAAGARVEHRIWTHVSRSGRSVCMSRRERYDLVGGGVSTKLTPSLVDTLARRGLIKVHQIGGDDPIREVVEGIKSGDNVRVQRGIDAGVSSKGFVS